MTNPAWPLWVSWVYSKMRSGTAAFLAISNQAAAASEITAIKAVDHTSVLPGQRRGGVFVATAGDAPESDSASSAKAGSDAE